jgi:hypothetical protein
MEGRVILRGVFAGFIAGVFGWIFSKIFVEPFIDKAIDYESGRDAILEQLNRLAGRPVAPDGPEIFSRSIQSTIGIASGLILFSMAMGALVAVVYLVLHGRFRIRTRTLAFLIAGGGFLAAYLLPFVKYPANPPAIGHSFTITTRGELYLTMVVCSLLFLVLAAVFGHWLSSRVGVFYASLLAAGAFLVAFSILIGLLPSLGNLPANVAQQGQFGFARASTETPQPITDLDGHLVYPGFDADVLWRFRVYSVINQAIIWGTIGLVFGVLVERVVGAGKPDPIPGDSEAAWVSE